MGPPYRTSTSHQTKQQEPVIDIEARVLSPKSSLTTGASLLHASSGRRRRQHSGFRRATKWAIIVGIAALGLLLYFTHVSSRVTALRSQQQLLREREQHPIDVVAVSLKPSCVTRQAVASLNAHLRPRTIHIVTTGPEKCALFGTFASNVACHLQDGFLPGLTLDRVGGFLQRRLGLDQHRRLRGRELSGWYMQQLVKLGSVLALPGLSEHYLVWDLDMVLLRPVQLLWRTTPTGGDLAGGQVQTLVNIGGSVSPGYIASFQRLFNRGLEFAPDGTSFVTHWMVIYKPYLREFLRELAAVPGPSGAGGGGGGAGGNAGDAVADGRGVAGDAGDALDGSSGRGGPLEQQQQEAVGAMAELDVDLDLDLDWAWRILGAVDPATADLGFSEYASYISWVRQRYPHSQRLAPRKTWVRHPFGQGAVKLLRLLRPDRCCCPSGALLRLVRALGFVYTGYEVGHIAECRYDALEHATSYGL